MLCLSLAVLGYMAYQLIEYVINLVSVGDYTNQSILCCCFGILITLFLINIHICAIIFILFLPKIESQESCLMMLPAWYASFLTGWLILLAQIALYMPTLLNKASSFLLDVDKQLFTEINIKIPSLCWFLAIVCLINLVLSVCTSAFVYKEWGAKPDTQATS